MKKLKLGVIGGGGSGLCAIKNAIDYSCDVIAFEQTSFVGGLWNYTDETEKDKYGLDIHSSMYRDLKTNLPIELMCYPNEPFRNQRESFVNSEEVLEYYKNYAEKYNLRDYIKFEHHVFRVRPLIDDTWEVVVKNLREDKFETFTFDAILICSGHHHTPNIPKFKGNENFRGKQIHSHFYRSSHIFEDQKTLIIGGNNSAVDLVIDSTKKSKFTTIWSHHLNNNLDLSQFDGPVIEKPDILEIFENGVKFIDGSFEECSMIVYATGYLYSYPFLSVDCGITCGKGEFVRPLWMHCLNINKPSLGFIGLANLICPNQLFQLQVEFCLTFMTGRKELPSTAQMMEDYERDMKEKWSLGYSERKGHFLGFKPDAQKDYYIELAEKAEINQIMPCILKMHAHTHCNRMKNFTAYRNVKYTIIDENNFEVHTL